MSDDRPLWFRCAFAFFVTFPIIYMIVFGLLHIAKDKVASDPTVFEERTSVETKY